MNVVCRDGELPTYTLLTSKRPSMKDEPHKVGEPIGEIRPAVFELIVADHVPFVDPKDFGLKNEKSINPADYFITSGDAVEKTRFLEGVIWQFAGELRKKSYELIEEELGCTHSEAQVKFRDGIRPSSLQGFPEYEAAVWKAAGCVRKLKNALLRAKGEDCFLETEWNNHKLLCIPKNPRK
jgi:hypothetical protein